MVDPDYLQVCAVAAYQASSDSSMVDPDTAHAHGLTRGNAVQIPLWSIPTQPLLLDWRCLPCSDSSMVDPDEIFLINR